MNVEHLYEIASDLKQDLKTTGYIGALQALVDALQNQVNAPSPENQSAIAVARDNLYSALESSKVNEYPELWVTELNEMKLRTYFGTPVVTWIESILQKNQITVAQALSDITSIKNEMVLTEKHLDNLMAALKYLAFKPNLLSPGEFEIGVKIPRQAVKNEIGKLGKEFENIEKIFKVFSELVTGSRESYKVKSISNSDFTVYLHTIPVIAAAVAVTIEKIVSMYNGVLDLIIKHKELSEKKVPAEVLDGLKLHITTLINSGIEDIRKATIDEFGKNISMDRKQEIETELTKRIKEIAARLDNGYGFDVRGEKTQSAEKSADEAGSASPADNRDYEQVVEARKKLLQFRPQTEPILSLPSPDVDDFPSPKSE